MPSFTSLQRRVLITTIVLSALVFFESTMISIAFPSLQRIFDAPFGQVQWVLSAFTVPLVALLIIAGRLSDKFGPKRVTVWGVWVFLIAMAIGPFMNSLRGLIMVQFLAGVGGGLLTPGSLVLLMKNISGKNQGRAVGLWSGYSAGIAIAGPVLGGFLLNQFGWQSLFVALLPLSLSTLFLLRALPHDGPTKKDVRIDVWGSLLVAAVLILFVVSLTDIQTYNAVRDVAKLSGLGFLLSFLMLAIHVAQHSDGVLPHAFFARRDLVLANIITAAIYGSLQVIMFFLIIVYDEFRFTNSTYTGFALVPSVLFIAFLSGRMGMWTDKVGLRKPLQCGLGVLAIVPLVLLFGAVQMPLAVIIIAQLILGLGMAMIIPPITRLAIPSKGAIQGVASGINNAVARGVYVFAVVIAGGVAQWLYGGKLREIFVRAGVADTIPAKEAMGQLSNGARTIEPTMVDPAIFSKEIIHAFEQSIFWPFITVLVLLLLCIPLAAIATKKSA